MRDVILHELLALVILGVNLRCPCERFSSRLFVLLLFLVEKQFVDIDQMCYRS